MPTLCDLAGADIPANTDGLSIAPLLRGDEDEQENHEYLYFEYQSQLAVRRGDWKYFRTNCDEAPFSLEKTDDSEALYRLSRDRHEDHDLKNTRPERLEQLKSLVVREHEDYISQDVPPSYDPGRDNEEQS